MAGEQWIPPDGDRVPMNVHPAAREALRWLLTHDLSGTGVGYSEFVMASVHAYERGEWKLPGVPHQMTARRP